MQDIVQLDFDPQTDLISKDTEFAFKYVFDNQLNSKRQKAIIFYLMGFDAHEIADITGDNLSTVRSRLTSALNILKTGMRKLNG